jgi:molybdopterin synthase sulfur carrier subunit
VTAPDSPPGRGAGGDAELRCCAVATLRLFAAAREAAGTGRDIIPGDTVAAVLDEAARRYGEEFVAVLGCSRVWRNGEPADGSEPVTDRDEIAVLPPVSGGCR